ncbi:MAG: dipeptide ABC transporter ATP-binding protein [Kiloniellaceae bacterium]
MAGDILLSVRDLDISLHTPNGVLQAVRGTSFDLRRGESLGIVGESGSGKSMTAFAIMRLLPRIARLRCGALELDGERLDRIEDGVFFDRIAGQRISMIFQEPMTSLNPVYSVGRQMTESAIHTGRLSRPAARRRAVELLERVGIPAPGDMLSKYPHQFSGGQRQRLMIAMARMNEPELIIADDPTTALDVTIQAQIMALLADLQREFGMAMILISHDLGVVAEAVENVMVMYGGETVEQGPAAQVLTAPRHPYTRALMAAAPRMDGPPHRLGAIPGVVPAFFGDPQLCVFSSRCPHVRPVCRQQRPPQQMAGRFGGQAQRYSCVMPPAELATLPDTRAGDALPAPVTDTREIFAVRGLSREYRRRRGIFGAVETVLAVDAVDLSVMHGETFALVGESGSGKTTLARILLGLDEPTSGNVFLNGKPLAETSRRDRAKQVQPIFQDPYSSLNPRRTVAEIIERPLIIHGISARDERRRAVEETMDLVGLPRRVLHNYPSQMSGGQRQRVAIARALVPRPAVLVCDEPTSALDVSVQAQILNLLVDLQQELQLTYFLITHDLGVVHQTASRIAVMRNGRIVETGPARQVLDSPQEEYTRLLLSSVPRLEKLAPPAAEAGR